MLSSHSGRLERLEDIFMNEQKIKGLITELQCQTYFTQRGFNVSIPLNEDCRYDMIVDFNGILSRIQVKTCSISATGITIPCRSVQVNTKVAKAKKYDKDQIDFFATFYNENCYLIGVEECNRSKTLSFENKRVNQYPVNFIDDYLAEKQIQKLLKTIPESKL